MPPNPLARVRAICLALPEAHEVEAWGEATFRVRNKLFAMYASAESHHGGGRPSIWIKAAAGNQSLMLQFAPHRFFVPPYVGPSGWVGVWLDSVAQWAELEELLRDAYRLTAPKRVAAQLDAAPAATERPTSKRSASEPSPKSGARKSSRARTVKGTGTKAATKRRSATASGKKTSTRKRATNSSAKKRTGNSSAKKRTAKRGAKPAARKRRG